MAGMNREGISEAALRVIGRRGLSAFSIKDVAEELNVGAASIYYYFANRHDLLRGVARFIFSGITLPAPREGEDWYVTTIHAAVASRNRVLEYPQASPLLLQFFPWNLMSAPYDRLLSWCPLPPEVHLRMIEGIEHLTYASALFRSASAMSEETAPRSIDSQQFPHYARAIAAADPQVDFLEANLRDFLDGLNRP